MTKTKNYSKTTLDTEKKQKRSVVGQSSTTKTNSEKSDIAVSILINFHREGHLAQSTILSAIAALSNFTAAGLGKVEAVAILDSPDECTLRVIQANARFFQQIEIVDYRDLAQARNHGVQLTQGEFIAFLDGDDLWDSKWLTYAYSAAVNMTGPVVFHTEYFIAFGRENFARLQWDSSEPDFDALTLMQNWHFCNNSFAHRSIFLSYPYVSYDHESGFGSEDWHWSCETLAQGVRHTYVSNTAYFYRMRNDELSIGGDAHLGLGAKAGLLVRPSDLFMPSTPAFKRGSTLIQDIFKIDGLDAPHRLKQTPKKLPTQIIAEWAAVGKIEPDCFPSKRVLSEVRIFRPDIHYTLARIYRELIQMVLGSTSFIFLEYRAHRETLSAMNQILGEISTSKKKSVIFLMSNVDAFEPFERPNVIVIPLWSLCIEAGIGGNEIGTLITRLILQNKPQNIYNLWSSFLQDAVLLPFIKAFESLDINIIDAIFSSDSPDFFDLRFRREWVKASQLSVSRYLPLIVSDEGAKYIAARSPKSASAMSLANFSLDANCVPIAAKKPQSAMKESLSTKPSASPLVSCVLNVHREQSLMLPTLQSINELILHTITEENISIELVIILDDSDSKTRDIVQKFSATVPYWTEIVAVKNRDLGKSRNEGIRNATGKYIALLDADDLYSSDWVISALNTMVNLNEGARAVVHPQFNIYFGKERRIFEHKPLSPTDPGVFSLAFANSWTSLLFAERELLLELPFDHIEFSKGFAFEDWSWNLKSLRAGVSHLVATDSAHFIRLKSTGSLNQASVNAGAIFRPAGLFKKKFVKNEGEA